MHRPLAGIVGASLLALGAPPGNQLPYCQNRVIPVAFDVQGTWTVGDVAAQAETGALSRRARRSLIGCRLNIQGTRVELRNKKNESWGKSFDTPLLGQQTYDTKSKEFCLDFRTDPESLNLPRYVNAANIEIGTVLAADPGHVYFSYSGTWFHLSRAESAKRAESTPRDTRGTRQFVARRRSVPLCALSGARRVRPEPVLRAFLKSSASL